jgi:hypothetical protein
MTKGKTLRQMIIWGCLGGPNLTIQGLKSRECVLAEAERDVAVEYNGQKDVMMLVLMMEEGATHEPRKTGRC